jgi:hypothetical protein
LEKSGLIKRTEEHKSPKIVRWTLTAKWKDAMPILMSIIAFGSKWYADKVRRQEAKNARRTISTKCHINLQEKLINFSVILLVNASEFVAIFSLGIGIANFVSSGIVIIGIGLYLQFRLSRIGI